ncbi:MAG: hypothetical protein JSU85_05180 [Candidatus Zixiibacteriota bacterium]|nr:MAG: hypothetical protein JSU85_05180 [candidate division Zixibacteria bacterium]
MGKNELAIGILALIVYVSCLLNDFHTDDWIVLSILRDGFSFSDFLSMENSGRFRPLTNILLYLRYLAFGDNPSLYYLLNIILHAAVSISLYKMLVKIEMPEKAALLSAIFFTIYFQHYEGVIWLYGTIRLFAALFYIYGLWHLHDYINAGSRRSLVYFVIISFLGLFIVEDFVIAPIAFTVFAVLFSDRKNLSVNVTPVILSGIIGLSVYFVSRSLLIARPGIVEDYYYPGFHIFRVLFDYLSWFVIPSPAHPYFAKLSSSLGPLFYLWKGINIASTILFVPFSVWIYLKSPKQIRFFILLAFITLLPIVPLNYKVTSRNIYLPSLGFTVVGGYLFYRFIWNQGRRSIKFILSVLLMLYFAVNITAIDITTREYRTTQNLVRGIINDMKNSGLDFEKTDLVLLDHLPGRTIVGPAMIYRLNYHGSVIASNDPIRGPIDIKQAAESLYKEDVPFCLFDYRDGEMVEAKQEYIETVNKEY